MIIDRQRDFSLSWGEKCVRCGVGTSVKHPFCCERTRWVHELFEFSSRARPYGFLFAGSLREDKVNTCKSFHVKR